MNQNIPKITIQTIAFNVEPYIEECILSVINQSFTDFEWVILDNGCTDGTGEILEAYAARDSRIKLFKNKKNNILYSEPQNSEFVKYVNNLKTEYWCVIDSDDYIHKDFLQTLYHLAREYDTDIAIGGTEMFSEDNPKLRGFRCPPSFYAADITRLGDIFPQIYGSFRPIWGKLFKVCVIRRIQEYRTKHPIKLLNGDDTRVCLDSLMFSNSVIGIDVPLYYYRIRKTSHYNTQIDNYRYYDYVLIYNQTRDLLETWNKSTEDNLSFIAEVLYNSINDCLNIIKNSKTLSVDARLGAIETILSDYHVYSVLKENGFLNNLFVDIREIIKSIFENISADDLFIASTHYIYRLYRSIEMSNSTDYNKHNAFLMYLSAVCDDDNNNKFGGNLMHSFFSFYGKGQYIQTNCNDISEELLLSNKALLRELINSNFESAIKIYHEHRKNIDFESFEHHLKSIGSLIDTDWVNNAKSLVDQYISEENFEQAIDLLLQILLICPLDKEGLCYKLYFLTINEDILTALETAEALKVFHEDDSVVLALVGHAYVNAGLIEQAATMFQKALNICTDENQRLEILKELETIR